MTSLAFWKAWVNDYRYLWYAMATLFILCLGLLWFGYFLGYDGVIHWQKLQEQKVIDTIVHQFQLGPFKLDVPAESYAILEYMEGSSPIPNTTASYAFLIVFGICMTMLVSLITSLPKLWFYIGSGLFIVLMVTLRLEVIGIFGLRSQVISVAAMALYFVPAFFFNQFRPATPLVYRLVTFAAITIALAIIIGTSSSEPLPFYHLVITSFTGTLILAVIFIILAAHEIFAGFVYIASRGSSKSLQHLAILSTIYFVNALLMLLRKVGLIDLNFLYLDAFLVLTISAVLGIWGFRKREPLFANIFPFEPTGALLYLTLGAMCFATTAHHFVNANDPATVIIEHAIIFSHVAYGLIFLMYVVANFGALLWKNAAVHKILYNPVHMPYFTYRLAGFISMLAIVFYMGWYNYVYSAYAGFYNLGGDFYLLQNNREYAVNFYDKARTQGFQNHKANYALAVLNTFPQSLDKAHDYLNAANFRSPSAYSLTNAGNLYVRSGELRQAIETYRKNLTVIPGTAPLFNNLGVTFAKLKNYDSSVHYLSLARESDLTRTSAETNFFALAAIELIPIDGDSVYASFKNNSPGTLANVYAMSTALGHRLKKQRDPLQDSILDLYTATLLNNYILHHAKELDTAFTAKAFKIASHPANANFSEALKASLAFAYYHQGNITKALEVLAEQVYLSQSYQGKFNYIMGLWALEQGSPENAATYFNYADTYAYKDAPFYHAIAFTEAGRINEANIAWDSVAIRGDENQKLIASTLKRILALPAGEARTLNDAEKYQFCRYRIPPNDSLLFNRLYPTFQNENYKAQALLDFSRKLFRAGHLPPAIVYYSKIAGIKLSDKSLYEDIRFFELRLLAARRDVRGLATQINKGIEFDAGRSLEKRYYTALINEANGDTINAARNYQLLAKNNPYFEDGVIAAYEYARRKNPDKFAAYSILAEAVQVNGNSLPLLRVYHAAALSVGLDEYALAAEEKIRMLERGQ
jgi:hypothetical protein